MIKHPLSQWKIIEQGNQFVLLVFDSFCHSGVKLIPLYFTNRICHLGARHYRLMDFQELPSSIFPKFSPWDLKFKTTPWRKETGELHGTLKDDPQIWLWRGLIWLWRGLIWDSPCAKSALSETGLIWLWSGLIWDFPCAKSALSETGVCWFGISPVPNQP